RVGGRVGARKQSVRLEDGLRAERRDYGQCQQRGEHHYALLHAGSSRSRLSGDSTSHRTTSPLRHYRSRTLPAAMPPVAASPTPRIRAQTGTPPSSPLPSASTMNCSEASTGGENGLWSSWKRDT